MPPAVDVDQMMSARLPDVEGMAFAMIDRLQNVGRATQVQVMGILFLMLCQEFGLDERRMLEVAERILNDAENRNDRSTMFAVREYIRQELVK
jgi:hypothetical protein